MFRQNIRNFISEALRAVQEENRAADSAIPDFSVSAPENSAYGDYATNAALVAAKKLGKTPMDVAKELEPNLKADLFKNIVIAPPGFINFFISDDRLINELSEVSEKDSIQPQDWKEKKVIVEFTDPNPFKEFHIGHLYSNIVGETLARLFQSSGAEVKRANYQGDVGLHVAKALWGLQRNMEQENLTLEDLKKKDLHERIIFMGRAYADGAKAYGENETARQEINELNKKIFSIDESVRDLYESGRKWSLEYFDHIYERLGTKFDYYYFERDVGKAGLALVQENLNKGVFEESEGAIIFPGEKYNLHRRVFITSQGLPTYEAKELGLAPTKYKDFPYDLSVIVTGNEIVDYFKVLLAALNQIQPDLAKKTLHVAHGMIRLESGKMSSRTRDVIRAEDLLDEMKKRVLALMDSLENKIPEPERSRIADQIAIGAVKYSLLRVGIGKDIIFSFEKSLSLEGESGPYLQYTNARLQSILRKAGSAKGSDKISKEISPVEHLLLVMLFRFSEVVADATEDLAPHTLASYLYNLAKIANQFYHASPVLQESDAVKRAFRLSLVSGTSQVLTKGLDLLGIAAPEEM